MRTFLLPKKYFLYSIILIIYLFIPYDSYIINNQFSNTQNISQSLCPALNSVLSSLSRTTRNGGNYSYNTLTITKLTSTNNLKICSTFSTPNSTCCSEQTEQIFRVAAIHRFNTLLATTFSNTLLKPYLLILQNISEVYQINIFYLAKSMVNDAENHLYDSILSQSIQNITRQSTTFTTLLNLSDLTQSYKHRLWDKLKPAIIHNVLHPEKNDYTERYKQCLTNIPDNLLVANTSNNFDHLHNLTDTFTIDAIYKTNASNEWLTRLRLVDMLQYTYHIIAYGLQRQLLPFIYDDPLYILDRYNKTQSYENQYINIKQKPKLSYSTQCEWALTKMFYCQSCALDIPESHKNDIIRQKFKEPTVPPKSPFPICRGMCHNIASACLSDLEGLGTVWNHLTWILTTLFQQLRDLTLLLHQNQNSNATDDTLKNGNSHSRSSAFLRMIHWLKSHATRLENEVETKCGVASFINTRANSLTNIIHSDDIDNQTNFLTQKLTPHLLGKNGGTTDEEWFKSILVHTNSILTQALSHIHNESQWRLAFLPLKQSPQKRSSFKSYFGTAFDGGIEKISELDVNKNVETYSRRQHSMKYGSTFSAVPDTLCALDESVSSNNKGCWDGEMVGRYSKNLVKFGRQALLSNPELVEIEDYFDSHSTVFDSSLSTPLLNKPYQADTLINELNSIRSKLISMGIVQQQSEKQLTSQFQNLQSTKTIVAMTTQPYTFPFLPTFNKDNLKFHNNDKNNQNASIETQLYASHTSINSPGYQGSPMISQLIDNSHFEKSFFNSDTNDKPSAQNSRDRPMLNNNPLLMDMEDGVKDTPSIPNSVMGSGMNPFESKKGEGAQQLLNSDERFINTNINNNNNKLARLNNAVVDDEDLVNALSAIGGSGSSPFNTYQQSSSIGKTKSNAHDDLLVVLEGHHGLTVEGSGLTPDTESFKNQFSKNLTMHGKGVYNDKTLHYSPSQHTAGPKIIDDIIARNDINQDGKSQRSTHTSDGFNSHPYNFQMTFLTIFVGWSIYLKFILIA